MRCSSQAIVVVGVEGSRSLWQTECSTVPGKSCCFVNVVLITIGGRAHPHWASRDAEMQQKVAPAAYPFI